MNLLTFNVLTYCLSKITYFYATCDISNLCFHCRPNTVTEIDKDESCLSSGEPATEREEPLGHTDETSETDKENNNGTSTDETQAERYNCRETNKTHKLSYV